MKEQEIIYVHLNGRLDEVTPILKTFLVLEVFKTLKVENNIEEIVKAGKDIMEDKQGTFKVITKEQIKV